MGELPAWARSAASSPSGLLLNPKTVADYQETLCRPGAFQEVADPSGGADKILACTVLNTDGAPITPTEDPRGQLLTPCLWWPNSGFWVKGKVMFPLAFPALAENKFFQYCEIFGFPFEGSPPFQLALRREGAEEFHCWQRNATYEFDFPWMYAAPLRRGVPEEFVIHYVYEEQGVIELWWNGVQVEFFNPASSFNPKGHEATKRLVMKTLDASNNKGANRFYYGQYRKKGLFETATTYHWPLKFGLTKASVEG